MGCQAFRKFDELVVIAMKCLTSHQAFRKFGEFDNPPSIPGVWSNGVLLAGAVFLLLLLLMDLVLLWWTKCKQKKCKRKSEFVVTVFFLDQKYNFWKMDIVQDQIQQRYMVEFMPKSEYSNIVFGKANIVRSTISRGLERAQRLCTLPNDTPGDNSQLVDRLTFTRLSRMALESPVATIHISEALRRRAIDVSVSIQRLYQESASTNVSLGDQATRAKAKPMRHMSLISNDKHQSRRLS